MQRNWLLQFLHFSFLFNNKYVIKQISKNKSLFSVNRESDIQYSWTVPDEYNYLPEKVCDYVKENGTADFEEDEEQRFDEHGHRLEGDVIVDHFGHRVKRQSTGEAEKVFFNCQSRPFHYKKLFI